MLENARYNRWSMLLHWLMFLLLVAVYLCIELRGSFERGSAMRANLKEWHFMLGLSVFALVWLRLLLRLMTRTPPIHPKPPGWMALAAKAGHLLIYVFMIAMPLAGWVILSAEGDAIPFFGLELPPLTGPDHDTAETVEDVHEWIGKAGYFLLGAHALAGLLHHYVLKDNTLKRMLPGKRS